MQLQLQIWAKSGNEEIIQSEEDGSRRSKKRHKIMIVIIKKLCVKYKQTN